MEFVTIHDLSRELNVPARVVRYRLINLIAESKLTEGDDFRRDDFKDDQHFVWKINPLSFMRETALKPVTPVNHLDNHPVTTVASPDNQSLPAADLPRNAPASVGNEPTRIVNQSDNNASPSVTKTVPVDNKEPSLEREMIELLKDQIKVKDGQLREQGEQLKDVNDLNVKLTGTMLQQQQKIENLLRLTGGKSEVVNASVSPENMAQAA